MPGDCFIWLGGYGAGHRRGKWDVVQNQDETEAWLVFDDTYTYEMCKAIVG